MALDVDDSSDNDEDDGGGSDHENEEFEEVKILFCHSYYNGKNVVLATLLAP